MTKEQKFYNALNNIFVGAKVEGESGYINLMKIKSRYYEKGVFPKLQKDIDEAVNPFSKTHFREELFEKLYTFFNRYFSESGSIYFRYTPLHQNVYEKVYTDDKDVMLFWKTHMLYYVKTDRLFKNLEVEVDNSKFLFDVSQLEHKKAFEKKSVIYDFKEKKKNGTFVFDVSYTERGKKTKITEILRALKEEGITIKEDVLERAFRIFEKQSEVDYFINKNAKGFLREQFNIWLYQYVFSGESEWTEKRIKQLQILKDIAFKIIDFISQFEDELIRIWNKPKFVLNSNYVITLDRILNPSSSAELPHNSSRLKGEDKGGGEDGINIIKKILKHSNLSEQIKEWKDLGIVEEDFNPKDVIATLSSWKGKQSQLPLKGTQKQQFQILNKKYKHLPIDTKYFRDLELEILGLFDNLDESLDGRLIKSENYQALNTILPKFKEKVQTVYIDPPFNKEQDADYFYSVKYKDASWITLLENRLQLAKDTLDPKGSIFVRCDYNGNMYVRLLMNKIFGTENYRNEIIINRRKFQMLGGKTFSTRTETVWLFSKGDNLLFNKIRRRILNPAWKPLLHLPGKREKPVRFIEGKKVFPPAGRHFGISQVSLDIAYKEGRVRFNEKGQVEIFVDSGELNDNWTDIDGYAFGWEFPTENSEPLLKRVTEIASGSKDIVMDFFLGSGTTTAVAHKLRRKWLGVEMGDHFYTVVLPRMKKVLAYDKSGISKEKEVKDKYNQNNAGGFFKYYELEQYEDTLRKVKYEDSDLFDNSYVDPYNQYIFMKDLKMLKALKIDYKDNKVKVDLSKLYPLPNSPLSKGGTKGGIDIPETLSNLLGKNIKKITADEVEFEDGEKVDIKNLDYNMIKPLIWW